MIKTACVILLSVTIGQTIGSCRVLENPQRETEFWDERKQLKKSEGALVFFESANGVERLRTGTWRTWHRNGILASEMTFHRGSQVGLCRSWYENGQIRQSLFFNDAGRAQGLIRWWKRDGDLLMTSMMNDGTGSEFYFDDDYRVRTEIRYIDGEVHEELRYPYDAEK